MQKLTKKKVIVVGHSMANLNILYNLGLMAQDEKLKLVRGYMAIGPPYLGAYKASKILLSNNDELITFGGKLGFKYGAQAQTISSQLSIYEIIV